MQHKHPRWKIKFTFSESLSPINPHFICDIITLEFVLGIFKGEMASFQQLPDFFSSPVKHIACQEAPSQLDVQADAT